MRLWIGLVLVVACSADKATPKPALDAPVVAVTAPLDAAPPPLSVELHAREPQPLGDLTLTLEPMGGGSGPGISTSMAVLHVQRGDQIEDLDVSEVAGGMNPHDADTERVVFDRLLVIDEDQGLTVTLYPGPPPAALGIDAAVAMLVAEAKRTGRPLGDLESGSMSSGFRSGNNEGVYKRVVKDGERVLWGAQVGLYTRSMSIWTRWVKPPLLARGVLVDEQGNAKLPGGIRATWERENRLYARLTLRKGRQTAAFDLPGSDAEVIAFGRLFVVQGDVEIVAVPGKVPEPMQRPAAMAAVRTAVAASGFPMVPWDFYAAQPLYGIISDYTNLAKFDVADDWHARVGLYTGRVWIHE